MSKDLKPKVHSDNHAILVVEENGYRISASLSKRKTVNRLNVVLEGELGLKNVNRVSRHLKPMLHEYDYLNLQLKNISEFDLSSLQLFWHLKRNAQHQGKTVAIIAQLPQELQHVIVNAGLRKIISEK